MNEHNRTDHTIIGTWKYNCLCYYSRPAIEFWNWRLERAAVRQKNVSHLWWSSSVAALVLWDWPEAAAVPVELFVRFPRVLRTAPNCERNNLIWRRIPGRSIWKQLLLSGGKVAFSWDRRTSSCPFCRTRSSTACKLDLNQSNFISFVHFQSIQPILCQAAAFKIAISTNYLRLEY